MDNIKQKSVAATKWSLITEVVTKLLSPIINMVLARLLTPSAFGAVAVMTMVVSFAEVFTDAGFQKYVIQKKFEDKKAEEESINVAFWSNFIMSLIAVLIIVFFRDQIAAWVGSPDLGLGIAVSSISILLVAFSSIQIAVYKRKLDFKTLFYARMAISVTPIFVTIPLALIFRNYWALVIGTIGKHLFQSIVLVAKSEWKIKFFYSFRRFREMFSFSAWSLLEPILIWFTGYSGIFIIGRYLNDHYLGLYRTVITTVNSYMGIVTGSVVPVLFATLSRCQDDDLQYKNTLFDFKRMFALFSLPMGVGMFVFSDLVTTILLGSQWMEASRFMGLWALMNALTVVVNDFAGTIYRSKGKPNISVFSQIIYLIFLIPITIWGAKGGFDLLCTARPMIRIIGALMGLIIVHIIFKIKAWEVLKNLVPQFVCAITMGVVGHFLLMVSSHMVWQFVSVFICIIVYFGLIMLFPSMRKVIFGLKPVNKIAKKLKLIKEDVKI